eukprot:6191797-Pleurochrysis_carterae.AAC.1
MYPEASWCYRPAEMTAEWMQVERKGKPIWQAMSALTRHTTLLSPRVAVRYTDTTCPIYTLLCYISRSTRVVTPRNS